MNIRRFKFRSIYAVLTAAVLCALTQLTAYSLELGADAGTLKLSPLSGGKLSAPAMEGGKRDSVTVLYFWTLHCRPCTAGIPFFNALAEKFKGQGAEFASVLCDMEKNARKSAKICNTAATPLYADETAEITRRFMRVQDKVPFAAIIGRDNVLLWRGRPDAAAPVLEKILNGTYDLASAADRDRFDSALTAELLVKNYPGAEKLLSGRLKKHPEEIGLILLRAKITAFELKQEQKALGQLGAALAANPQNYALYEAELAILSRNGSKNIRQMQEVYRRAGEKLKNTGTLLFMLRQLLTAPQKEWTVPCAYSLIEAMRKRPLLTEQENVHVLHALANVYYREGKTDKAVGTLQEAMKLNSDEKLKPKIENDLQFYLKKAQTAE